MNRSVCHDVASGKAKWYIVGMMAALAVCPGRSAAQSTPATPVQIVALDECDPKTFNAKADARVNPGLGPGFCKNIALGATTTLQELFTEASQGTPDPAWDFEPDTLKIATNTPLVVSNQGGEPHTFTEVKQFGGGFVTGLNNGEPTVTECSEGFKNIAVARTRVLQGSQLLVGTLAKGDHYFQCCIHPWMRVKVEVKEPGDKDKK